MWNSSADEWSVFKWMNGKQKGSEQLKMASRMCRIRPPSVKDECSSKYLTIFKKWSLWSSDRTVKKI